MFSRMKNLTGTALALVLLSSPAFAADINADGAAKLKALIQSQLDLRKNVQSAAGGSYITEGDLKVEQADGYYAVTFPHTKIKDATGKIYDIGMIAANVIPGATENEWKAAIAIPTPIKILNADNTPAGQFDLGKQRAVGIWDTELSSFIRLDANYDNVVYKDAGNTVTVSIGNIAAKNQLAREANGNLSGPASGVLTNWDISATNKTHATIKEVRFDVTVKDFDPKVAKSFNEQVGALGQSGQPLASPDTSAQHGLALYNMLTTVIGKSSDAFSSRVSVSDVKLDAVNEETQAAEGFTLGSGALGFNMAGFRAGSVKTGLQISYNDFVSKEVAPDDDLIPQTLNLDMTINNLPFQQLVDLGRDTINASSGDASGMAGMQAMLTVPKLLTDAGTNLTHTFNVSAPLYKSKGNGVVNANLKAILGYTADQNLEFEGLDKLITRINEEIKANPDAAQDLQGPLGTLTIMQMVGQKDAGNPDLRTYKLIVNEQGQMLLNGSDMTTLMGGAAPQATPAPAPDSEGSPAE